jgi:hypothetical protein
MRTSGILVLAGVAISCAPGDGDKASCPYEELRCPEGAELHRWFDSDETYCQYSCTVSCDGVDYNTHPTTLVVDAGEPQDEQRDVCRFSLGEDVGYFQAYPTCVLPVESPYPDPNVVEGPDYRVVIVESFCAR